MSRPSTPSCGCYLRFAAWSARKKAGRPAPGASTSCPTSGWSRPPVVPDSRRYSLSRHFGRDELLRLADLGRSDRSSAERLSASSFLGQLASGLPPSLTDSEAVLCQWLQRRSSPIGRSNEEHVAIGVSQHR